MLTPQQFLEKYGWVPIGTERPMKIGDIDVEDDPQAPAPLGTKYVVTGYLSEADARAYAWDMGLQIQSRYKHFYKAVLE
jgi:hypothetical protein